MPEAARNPHATSSGANDPALAGSIPADHLLRLQAEVVQRMGDGVLLGRRDGTILFANPAMESMMGYARGELAGRNAFELSFRSRAVFEGLLQTVFEATQGGGATLIELEGRRRDGSRLPVQGRLSSLQLGDERYLVAVFTDISARKPLEREMLQIATQAQHRAGGDLHEGLGQQLTGIAMMLQALQAQARELGAPALGGELSEVVGLLNAAVQSTRQLARGLSPVRPSAQGLAEGFEELVNRVHAVYKQRVRLQLELPANLAVDANAATNLFHIAQEAVENAARHASAGRIQLILRATGGELDLQVIDDGDGFDPVQAGVLGMGLRMMRFRAEMARGYLSLESRPGHGTQLRCRCPARSLAGG